MAAPLEYVFEGGEQNSPNAVTKEKAAEIAADFMTTFYHVQVGALETQEFRTQPVPFWLICFRTRSRDRSRSPAGWDRPLWRGSWRDGADVVRFLRLPRNRT